MAPSFSFHIIFLSLFHIPRHGLNGNMSFQRKPSFKSHSSPFQPVSIRHSVLPYFSPFHVHSILHPFNFIFHAPTFFIHNFIFLSQPCLCTASGSQYATQQATVVITLRTCIREAFISNLGEATDYPDVEEFYLLRCL